MTEQEIFDKVMKHILSMKEPSTNESGLCCYGSSNTSMCAVSIFAESDEQRREWDEFCDIEYVVAEFEDVPKVIYENVELMGYLQQLHDRKEHWGVDGFNLDKASGFISIIESRFDIKLNIQEYQQ